MGFIFDCLAADNVSALSRLNEKQIFLASFTTFSNYLLNIIRKTRKWQNSKRRILLQTIQKIRIENYKVLRLEKLNTTKRTKWLQKSRKKLWVSKLKLNLTLEMFYMLKVEEKC